MLYFLRNKVYFVNWAGICRFITKNFSAYYLLRRFALDISCFSIAKLKQMMLEPNSQNKDFWQALAKDERIGVRKLYQSWQKGCQQKEDETNRLKALFWREDQLKDRGFSLVCGVDEAGRGPLAGPVVAAAVILPSQAFLPSLNDSKKLGEKKRNTLALEIKKSSLAWAIGVSSVWEIDEYNILEASLFAMRRAVSSLRVKPDYILTDGNFPTKYGLPESSVIKGDGLCACIAAASILAKVKRDALMLEYHEKYPQYGFDKHKGYGTLQHLRALKKYGPCFLHRSSFAPIKELLKFR